MALNKVRVQLLDATSGAVLQEVDVLTSADAVEFTDGTTFQEKLNAGTLKGATGNTGLTGTTGVQGIQGIQGPKGDTGSQGPKGDTGSQGIQGNTGSTGVRGSLWYGGVAVTGTSTTATVFSTGLTSSLVGDRYINTSTGYIYNCTVAGVATVAKWVYDGSIKGATGSQGIKGETGDKGAQGIQGATGETVRIGTTYATGTQAKLFFKLM